MGSLSRATGSDAKYGEPSKASSSISTATGGAAGTPVSSGGVSAATGSDTKYGAPTQSPTMTVNGQVVANPNYVGDNYSTDVATRTQSNVLPAPKPLYRDEYGENVYSNREMDVYSRTQVATTPRGTFIGRAARYVEGGQTLSLPPNTSTPQGDVYTPAPYEVPGQSSMYQNVPAQFRSPGLFGGERIDVGAYERATAPKEPGRFDVVTAPLRKAFAPTELFFAPKVAKAKETYSGFEAKVSSKLPSFFSYDYSKTPQGIVTESRALQRAAAPTFLLLPKAKQRASEVREISKIASSGSYQYTKGIYTEFKERPVSGTIINVGTGAAFGAFTKIGLTSSSAPVKIATKGLLAVGAGWYAGTIVAGGIKAENKPEYFGRETLKVTEFSLGAGLGAKTTGFRRIGVTRTEVVGTTVTREVTVGQTRGRMMTTIIQGRGYAESKFLGVSYKTPLKFVGKQEAFFKVGEAKEPFKMAEQITFYKGSKPAYIVSTTGTGVGKVGEGYQAMTLSRTYLRRPSGKIMTYSKYADSLTSMDVTKPITSNVKTPFGQMEVTKEVTFTQVEGTKFAVGRKMKIQGRQLEPIRPVSYGRGVSKEVFTVGDTSASILKMRVISGKPKEIIAAQKSGDIFLNRMIKPGERVSDFAETTKITGAKMLASKRATFGESGTITRNVLEEGRLSQLQAFRRYTLGTIPSPRVKPMDVFIPPTTLPLSRTMTRQPAIVARRTDLIGVSSYQMPSTRQNDILKTSPTIISGTGMRLSQRNVLNLGIRQNVVQEQSQIRAIDMFSGLRTATSTSGIITQPLTPTPRPGAIPFFQLEPTKRRKKKGKQPKISFTERYVPSVEALALNIRSPKINMGAIRTGLVVRPIKV